MSTLNIAINTGRRLIHRVHVRMGANGLAGIGLVVIAGLALAYAQRAQQESVQLQAQTEQARTRMTEVSAQHLEPSAPADRLARFQNWFPPVDTSTADLRKIFRAAQASRVNLARGEYSLAPIEGSGGLQKFDVVLPVKENYGEVKNFIALVLNELPHASLTELRVERQAAGANELDTRVHFTLYYRGHAT